MLTKIKTLFQRQPTDAEVVEMIHEEIDTAQDRLLQEANELLNNIKIKPVEASKEEIASRLKNVGFRKTRQVIEVEKIRDEAWKERMKESELKDQAKLITYYKETYPFCKFLTEEELDRICDKYNLVYAQVENYINDVPEKNLRDIENAQELKDVDKINYRDIVELQEVKKRLQNLRMAEEDSIIMREALQGAAARSPMGRVYFEEMHTTRPRFNSSYEETIWRLERKIMDNEKAGLFIAAPKSHFDLKGLEQKGKGFFAKQEPKDPIVFRYVRGGIQVLTKWGLEASDPALQNPIDN